MAPTKPVFINNDRQISRRECIAQQNKFYSTIVLPEYRSYRCRTRGHHHFTANISSQPQSIQKDSATITTITPLPIRDFPPEVILEILERFKSFKCLHAFISSSSAIYRAFTRYRGQVLAQVGKNILRDSWGDATTLLVYQRNQGKLGPNFDSVVEQLGRRFVLLQEDIPHLIAGQNLFNSCQMDAVAMVAMYHHAPAPPYLPRDHLYFPLGPNIATRTNSRVDYLLLSHFAANSLVSSEVFYRLWVLNIQFKYGSIKTFKRHETISKEQTKYLQLMAHLMFKNFEFKNIFGWVGRKINPGSPEGLLEVVSSGLIPIWSSGRFCHTDGQPRSALHAKLLFHFCAQYSQDPRFLPLLSALVMDQDSGMTVGELIEKYRLDEDLEGGEA